MRRVMLCISSVIFFYESLSLILPLRSSPALKIGLVALFFLGAFKNSIFPRVGYGLFFAPDLPRPFVLADSMLYNLLIVALTLAQAKDVIWLVWKIFIARPFPAAAASTAVLIIASVLTVWGTWEAVRVPDVKRHDVFIENLPSAFDGKKIAVVVDLHVSSLNRRPLIQSITDLTNELKPDIILMPGDFVDGTVSKFADDLAPLAELRAPLGIFGSSGNHEYYSGYTEWRPHLGSLGIKMLDNEHVLISCDDAEIAIAGVPDMQGERFGFEGPNLEKALDGIPDDVPVILLSHRPGLAHRAATKGIELQLSGHTHGGMMPILDRVVAHMNEGFVKGWYDVGEMKLFNSPGTSLWNGFPLRILDPAEISLITLHSKY